MSEGSAIRFCSLGSGSKGNATLVTYGTTKILVDCGFSTKETVKRLALKGLSPEQLSAILVTHEHTDHIAGVARLSNRFAIPVWLNRGTSLHKKCAAIKSQFIFNSHQAFSIDDIFITPVPVPHDSREATQFIFSAEGLSIGLLTDVGHITDHIIEAYSSCDALLLEFNYEHQILLQGKYPYALKKRVSGEFGHLSNQQAIQMLTKMDLSNLQLLAVMHMSEENNQEKLVLEKIQSLSDMRGVTILLANQTNGFDWQSLNYTS